MTPAIWRDSKLQISWSWQSLEGMTVKTLYEVLRMRQNVFIIEQNSLYADIDGRDAAAWHLLGHADDGRLAAYLRVFPGKKNAPETTMGRFVVAPWARGKGLARQMMANSLAWVNNQAPSAPIRISAQRHLKGFYETFGFTAVGAPYDDAGVAHVDMVRPPCG
jgi:ElaA protein